MLTIESISEEISKHFAVLILGVFSSLVTGFIAWQRGFFQKLDSFYVPVQGRSVLRGFLFFLLAQTLIVPALAVVFFFLVTGQELSLANLSLAAEGWLSIGVMLGGWFGVILAFWSLPIQQRNLLWGNPQQKFFNLLFGALTWFISYPFVLAMSQLISIVILWLFHQPQIDQIAVKHLKKAAVDPILLGVMVVSVSVIVPTVEELLFRGFMQSWIKYKLKSPLWAIVLTSFIFALFHYSTSQGLTNIELLFSLFILSCFLGYIYERQRSLWAPIGLHAFFNFISVLMIIQS